eukprot:508140-Pleurochrysis_carterae.AAC.1
MAVARAGAQSAQRIVRRAPAALLFPGSSSRHGNGKGSDPRDAGCHSCRCSVTYPACRMPEARPSGPLLSFFRCRQAGPSMLHS